MPAACAALSVFLIQQLSLIRGVVVAVPSLFLKLLIPMTSNGRRNLLPYKYEKLLILKPHIFPKLPVNLKHTLSR